mgnify:CR=1 FL=1
MRIGMFRGTVACLALALGAASPATAAELMLYLLGNAEVQMSAIGFAVRLVLLASIIIIFVLSIRLNRARAAD